MYFNLIQDGNTPLELAEINGHGSHPIVQELKGGDVSYFCVLMNIHHRCIATYLIVVFISFMTAQMCFLHSRQKPFPEVPQMAANVNSFDVLTSETGAQRLM